MGKFLIICRIQLKFRFLPFKKRWHTSWKFQLEITSNKKVIAKKPLTNLLEMNSRQMNPFLAYNIQNIHNSLSTSEIWIFNHVKWSICSRGAHFLIVLRDHILIKIFTCLSKNRKWCNNFKIACVGKGLTRALHSLGCCHGYNKQQQNKYLQDKKAVCNVSPWLLNYFSNLYHLL